MHTQRSLVSVIIPTYNRASTICAAIDSALAQTYSAVEVIVIDDGSTDHTHQLLQSYQQDRKIVYLRQDNGGAAAARNRGIGLARGEFIAFLDADDRWSPEKLTKQLPLFENQFVALVYSDMQFVGKRAGLYAQILRNGYQRGGVLPALIQENFVPTSSVVVRSAALRTAGFFLDDRRRVPIGEDYYLWLHVAVVGQFDYVSEPLVEYCIHEGQLSGDARRTYQSLVELFRRLFQEPTFARYRLQIFKRLSVFILKFFYYSVFRHARR